MIWWQLKIQAYLCKNLRISCLAIPSSSHVCANFTLNCSALLLISCPFSLRHRSMVCRISMPTASRVPSAARPFLARGLRPLSPVLTWKSSKATLRFSEICADTAGWSAVIGQQILPKGKYQDELVINRRKTLQRDTTPKRFSNTIKTTVGNEPSGCLSE